MNSPHPLAVAAAACLAACNAHARRTSVTGTWVARIAGGEACPQCSSIVGLDLTESDDGAVVGIATSFTYSGYDIASGAGYVTGRHDQDSLILSAAGECDTKPDPSSGENVRAVVSPDGNQLIGTISSTGGTTKWSLPAHWGRAPLDSLLVQEIAALEIHCARDL